MSKKTEKKKDPKISCTPDKTTGVMKCKYEGPVYTLPPEEPKTPTETTTF
jgi:hypothetical protein